MVQSGDWVTPRLNGFKYFEKPPLQYWASAAALKAFGERDWSVRLFTGLMALFGVGMTFYAGRRLFSPSAGAVAAAVLASCPLYVLLGQISTLDMAVSVLLSAAIFAFAIAHSAGEESTCRRWMLMAWAACGLAVLSKGLIGIVLPAATVALYVLVRRDWKLVSRLEPLRGGVLFLAIAAPWFVAVSLRNSEFARFFFVQEHWQRFTTTIHHREHPPWYFVPVLAAGVAPWLLVVLAAWARAVRGVGAGRFSPALFLALWALLVFGFFSLSHSKMPPYILPMLPALAALSGAYLAGALHRRLLIAQGVLVVAVGIGLALGGAKIEPLIAQHPGVGAFVGDYRPWLVASALTLAAAGVLGALFARGERGKAAVACIAAGSLAATLSAAIGHRVFAPSYSAAGLAAAAMQAGGREARFYTVETYDHSIPWSLRRTVTMVGYKDELAVPIGWDADRFVPDLNAFKRAWFADGKAYAFFALRDFDGLRKELAMPLEEVARSSRYVLVRKP